MKILAIETSCDETSIAIVDNNRLIINRTFSQIRLHQAYQGVMPTIARRAHEKFLPILLTEVLKQSHISLSSQACSCSFCQDKPEKPISYIDCIAVTTGPGLPPALETGVRFAKHLALQHQLPLIPVNHLEGHLASIFLKRKSGTFYLPSITTLKYPHLALIVSGGHTELILTNKTAYGLKHQILGQTLDDAAGEVIDKVGRELGLGYPSGPVLESFAKNGNPQAFHFPLPLKNTRQDNLNFSFSGLKTKAVQIIYQSHQIGTFTNRPNESSVPSWSSQQIYDFAASFQQAVIKAIAFKVKRAMHQTGVYQLSVTGGVSANMALRKYLRQVVKQQHGRLYAAPKKFTGDNAAMIGLAAYWDAQRHKPVFDPDKIKTIDRQPNLNF